MFSCKFAAYFQNTFSIEPLWIAASGDKIYSTILNCLSHSIISNPKHGFSILTPFPKEVNKLICLPAFTFFPK